MNRSTGKRINPHMDEFVDPERLYTLKAFQAVSGIGSSRRWQARRAGIELQCLQVGKRKFVRGSDGIAYIEQLAEQYRQQREELENEYLRG